MLCQDAIPTVISNTATKKSAHAAHVMTIIAQPLHPPSSWPSDRCIEVRASQPGRPCPWVIAVEVIQISHKKWYGFLMMCSSPTLHLRLHRCHTVALEPTTPHHSSGTCSSRSRSMTISDRNGEKANLAHVWSVSIFERRKRVKSSVILYIMVMIHKDLLKPWGSKQVVNQGYIGQLNKCSDWQV